jgi:DNA-binding transcriptional ArsR family regulator
MPQAFSIFDACTRPWLEKATRFLDAWPVSDEPESNEPESNEPEPELELVLREPGQFKALGHPLRHRLLVALRQRPATLAQLAAALIAAKGTVGYHVKILQDAGLVRPAHARTVRGGTEQYYEATSQRLRIAPDAPVGGDFLVQTALTEMRSAGHHSPAAPGAAGSPGADRTMLRHLRLTAAQATALAERLESFAVDLAGGGDDGEPYGVLLSLYRSDIPTLPPERVSG